MKYNVHERNTQLTIIAHFDLEKRSKEMISDKLQTAFNRAVVPEMNCYFCYQPLFSFYQGTVEIMRHGVILRLVLESRLHHLRFWLICNITWDTNINKQIKKTSASSISSVVCAKKPIGKQRLTCHYHHHKASWCSLFAFQWLLEWSLTLKETF